MKSIIVSIVISCLLIGGAVILSQKSGKGADDSSGNNVSIIDGKQIVTISAKGGYSPQITNARAGMPTTLRVETNGTFDCSSALAIPSLKYQKNLPPSGVTEIELPPQKAGSKFEGLCAMGMYGFTIQFE